MQGGGQDWEALGREVMSPFSMFHQGPRVIVFSALELLEQALHGAAERVFRPAFGGGWEQGVLWMMWNAKSQAERARLERPSTLDLLQLCKAGKNVDLFRAFLAKAGIRSAVLDQCQALRNAVCHKAPLSVLQARSALHEITGLMSVLGATSQMEKVKTLSNGFALFRQKQQEAADTLPTSSSSTSTSTTSTPASTVPTSTSTSTTSATTASTVPTSVSSTSTTSTTTAFTVPTPASSTSTTPTPDSTATATATSSAPLPTASGPAPSTQPGDAPANRGKAAKRQHERENEEDVAEANTKRTKHPVIYIDSEDEDEKEAVVVIYID